MWGPTAPVLGPSAPPSGPKRNLPSAYSKQMGENPQSVSPWLIVGPLWQNLIPGLMYFSQTLSKFHPDSEEASNFTNPTNLA